jgi:trans-aconitate methyltransferase
MHEDTARRLRDLNRSFYERFAEPFAESRETPQPGWARMLADAPAAGPATVLDVGCGDGRFGRYLRSRWPSVAYTGIDFSSGLLARAREIDPAGIYLLRDLTEASALAGLGAFDAVFCLSALQHIPERARRLGLLRAMVGHLGPGGYIALANWQFATNERQQRKIRSWAEAGVEPDLVEPGDYLLSWERGGRGLRYVAQIDEAETRKLAAEAGMRVVASFLSDGREGDLNLYSFLVR